MDFQQSHIAAHAERERGQAEEAATAEVAAALKWTRRTADNEMGFAIDLRRRLPKVWVALGLGKIDL